MRLIDADALLEKVQFRNPIDNHNAEVIAGCVKLTRRIIDKAPTIDAVPVCRCKSCIHAKWSEQNKAYYCQRRWAMHKVRERDFCSYGKRKDGEG